MDKIDSVRYQENIDKFSNLQPKENEDHSYVEKNITATEFVSYIRTQTNKNIHLNYYTKKVHSEISKMDLTKLKQFRFDKLSKEEIVVVLSKCVIRVTDEIIVLNKPNGLSVQDGSSQALSIAEILSDLSKELKLKENLHIVHRLDKDTTGVLMLARNPEMAFLLKEAFRTGHIRKNYLCLTHGLPSPPEGIIDFRLKEKPIGDNVMIVPDMGYVNKSPAQKEKFPSTKTGYKTLCSNYNIALVQCATTSGVKHQVRAHLAYGLQVPILGDHKYSWFINSDKFPIRPQSLSAPALAGLKIPAGKTRCLPVYLHAHQVVIGDVPLSPRGFDGKADLRKLASNGQHHQAPCRLANQQFYANLPPFFVDTLKSLKLYDFRFLKIALKNIL